MRFEEYETLSPSFLFHLQCSHYFNPSTPNINGWYLELERFQVEMMLGILAVQFLCCHQPSDKHKLRKGCYLTVCFKELWVYEDTASSLLSLFFHNVLYLESAQYLTYISRKEPEETLTGHPSTDTLKHLVFPAQIQTNSDI